MKQHVSTRRGKPCISNYGYAKVTLKYDERGNQIEIAYFDEEGKPCMSNNGYFKQIRVYDKRNNMKEIIFIDKDGNKLAEQIFTRRIIATTGWALTQDVPIGSIMLQWNEWKIGDTQADFLMTSEKSRYGQKSIYYLTPAGEIQHLHIEKGLAGITNIDFVVEKSQAQAWLKQLEEWKKTH